MAANRVRFLTEDAPEPRTVRDTILASWRRSQSMQVAADKVEMRFQPDVPRADTRLSRSALPVLRSLSEQLQGQSVSVVLTDQTGLVLSRLTGDGELERHLDRVLLAPGFNYAEKFVGTNGIGTALEVGGPTHVFGHEHYAENLEELACAAVPIHHPITGRLVGAVDLTCWRKDAGSLLLTLAKTTAAQIRHALLTEAGAAQLELLEEFLRACNRRTGIVIALNSDVVMLNEHARASLATADQATLLAQASETLSMARRGTVVVELPTGMSARVYYRLVGEEQPASGVVAHVVLRQHAQGATSEPGTRELPHSLPLPSLVGSGAAWLHACHEVERVFRSGDWLAVEGEPGVGKLAVLRAVQLRRQPVGRFELLEARDAAGAPDWLATVRRTLTSDVQSVVVRHVDALTPALMRGLAATLEEARTASDSPPWVAVTLAAGDSATLPQLLRSFPSTIEIPPLRLHLEDLPLLVTAFLSRHSQGGRLTCSPEATRLLMRMAWPGNAEQLHAMLREVVRHRRTGSIRPEDLPPEVHAVSRRVLSPLEALERDAIVRCLAESRGNKVQAARSLGMSRATIYRKIHDYGLVPPTE